jgi:hypothetical protein
VPEAGKRGELVVDGREGFGFLKAIEGGGGEHKHYKYHEAQRLRSVIEQAYERWPQLNPALVPVERSEARHEAQENGGGLGLVKPALATKDD